MNEWKTKKIIAFTLAETLIVMGIIGVVAALTIPNLNSSTGGAEKVTKVKKIYAELNEAQNRAVAKYGPIGTWFVNDNCTSSSSYDCSYRYIHSLSQFMIVRDIATFTGSDSIKYIYGSGMGWPQDVIGKLPNGMSISVRISNPKCIGNHWYNPILKICGYVVLDIDGWNSGKKTYGEDVFILSIAKDGIFPVYSPDNCTDSLCSSVEVKFGPGAINWVLGNGNMDYKLLNSNGECPNNKSLGYDSGQVTSCK